MSTTVQSSAAQYACIWCGYQCTGSETDQIAQHARHAQEVHGISAPKHLKENQL